MAATEFRCTVESFKMLTDSVFEIVFMTEQRLKFEAGQFISVIIPGAGPKGRDLRRAYSIASSPENEKIELCVKLVEGGPGTNYLYTLRPGDTFRGVAPYGDFVYEPKPGKHACFVATGTGIAPFRAMALSQHYRNLLPVTSHFLLGVRDESELLYVDEFTALKPSLKAEWITAVSRPRDPAFKGFKGRVTDYLRAQGDTFPWLDTEFYLCGNSAMIDEMKAMLAERGVEKDSIHQEVYYKVKQEAAVPTP